MDSNFIENGYRPPTQVQGPLEITTLQNPSAEDKIHFFKSEGCTIPELQRAINSTILVSESSDTPGGSGVIVSYEGKKYVVTATHVIGDILAGEYSRVDELKYFYRDNNGEIKEGTMTKGSLLYASTTARERGLQVTDAAIFPFDGENSGAEISDLQVPVNTEQIAVAIGFPGAHQAGWQDSIKPLLSVGLVFKNKPKEMTPAMREILDNYLKETGEREGKDLNIYFTGRVMQGNSGGPLVDTQGKVIAVCHGPKGHLGKETDEERFSDFRSVLKEITKQNSPGV